MFLCVILLVSIWSCSTWQDIQKHHPIQLVTLDLIKWFDQKFWTDYDILINRSWWSQWVVVITLIRLWLWLLLHSSIHLFLLFLYPRFTPSKCFLGPDPSSFLNANFKTSCKWVTIVLLCRCRQSRVQTTSLMRLALQHWFSEAKKMLSIPEDADGASFAFSRGNQGHQHRAVPIKIPENNVFKSLSSQLGWQSRTSKMLAEQPCWILAQEDDAPPCLPSESLRRPQSGDDWWWRSKEKKAR